MVLRLVLLLIAALTAFFCQCPSKHKSTPQLRGVMQEMRLAEQRGTRLDDTGKVPVHAWKAEGSSQVMQRARRSWLVDYLGDVWSHFAENFPIAVLYIFPITVLVLLLLCCLTVSIE